MQVYKNGFIGTEIFADITNFDDLLTFVRRCKPDVILLQRNNLYASYKDPALTFAVNTMGVVNILEANVFLELSPPL